MALPQSEIWTAEQYLAFEREADARHELISGEVYAMAGASERHNQITSALNYLLFGQFLNRPYQVFQSDMQVQANEHTFFYPDIIVVCDEAKYRDDSRDNLLNPSVVIEVLSPSTEDYDRGRKFAQYRQITTLEDYVLVAQKQVQIEHYTRQNTDTWLFKEYTAVSQKIALSSIDATLALSDIYQKVDFDAQE